MLIAEIFVHVQFKYDYVIFVLLFKNMQKCDYVLFARCSIEQFLEF